MEHLLGWRKNGQNLKVVTSSFESSEVSWVGRLVNNETRFEVALELEPEQEGGRVHVCPCRLRCTQAARHSRHWQRPDPPQHVAEQSSYRGTLSNPWKYRKSVNWWIKKRLYEADAGKLLRRACTGIGALGDRAARPSRRTGARDLVR